MKIWKQFAPLAIIAIFGIIVCFITCDNGNGVHETFTVSFNSYGGSPAPQNQTITSGGKVTEPNAMTKTNCSHTGWYKESTFQNIWTFETDTITADITLHAKWDCACNQKEHLGIGEFCDCGGEDCNCGLQEYGELYPDSGIKIYRVGALSGFHKREGIENPVSILDYALPGGEETLAITAQHIKDAYDGMNDGNKYNFATKTLHEIHIFPINDQVYSVIDGIPIDDEGTAIYQNWAFCYIIKNGKYILGLREDMIASAIRTRLNNIAAGTLTVVDA